MLNVPPISPQSTEPIPPLEEIVTLSVAASVVMVMLLPATKVSVSLVVSATTLLCPDTAMVLNKFWSPLLVPARSNVVFIVAESTPRVSVPDDVIGLPPTVIPLLPVAATEVTVPRPPSITTLPCCTTTSTSPASLTFTETFCCALVMLTLGVIVSMAAHLQWCLPCKCMVLVGCCHPTA